MVAYIIIVLCVIAWCVLAGYLYHKTWKTEAAEKDHRDTEIDILKAEKKEMVELLGRIYMDASYNGARLSRDTWKRLQEWVNGK